MPQGLMQVHDRPVIAGKETKSANDGIEVRVQNRYKRDTGLVETQVEAKRNTVTQDFVAFRTLNILEEISKCLTPPGLNLKLVTSINVLSTTWKKQSSW
jgi:hypothetical protein